MKLSNAVLGLVLLAGSVGQAQTYKCAEKADKALEEGRLQYSVILVEKGKIDDPDVVGDNDYARTIKVSVLSRDPEVGGGFKADRPSFEAVGLYSDVHLGINAWKAEGFRFSAYLDDPYATIGLKGVAQNISLNCH